MAANDTAVAVTLDVLTSPLVHSGPSSASAWVLGQALMLPLALRRRHPSGVFAVIALVAAVQWTLGLKLPADAALVLALYTVAAHEVRGRAVAATAVLEVGVILASVRFAPTGDGVVGSLVFLTGPVAAAFLLGTSLQSRAAHLASLEDRAQRLEIERDQQARLIQVAERTRIAREMHDIVAHNLSVMITLSAGAAVTAPAQPEAAAAAMEQVARTGRNALSEMRALLGFLREDGEPTDTAPQPDLDQLDDLVGRIRSTGLPVRMSVRGRPRTLGLTTQLTIFRAVQEALTNTLKHARGATAASVLLDWQDDAVEVLISDDGVPPGTPPGGEHGYGMGLVGMRERVTSSGGTLTACPRPAGGWLVHIRLPVSAADAA